MLVQTGAAPLTSSVITVIDDDEAVRLSLEIVLRPLGRPVRSFESAEAFFGAKDDGCPSCIVLDINLPGMSGWSAIRALREAGCQSPVVAISGRELDTDHAMAQGATAALEKPLSPQQLLETLRLFLTQLP